jgi:hypothetical protein
MDLSKLATLKDLLLNGKEFARTWEYFLDHFGENSEFMDGGERTESALLEAVIAQVGQQLGGKPMPLKDLLLVKIPAQSFIHGGCVLGNKIANVIYFEDAQSGLIAIPWSASTGETKYARFSTQMMPRPGRGSPSVN